MNNGATTQPMTNSLVLPILGTIPAILDGYVMVLSSYDMAFVLCEVVLVACALWQWVLYFQMKSATEILTPILTLSNSMCQQEIWKTPRIDYKIAYADGNTIKYHFIEAWSLADALSQARFIGMKPVHIWSKNNTPGWDEVALPARYSAV